MIYQNQPSMALYRACIREPCRPYSNILCEFALEQYDLEPLLFGRAQHRNGTICEGESVQLHDSLYLMVEMSCVFDFYEVIWMSPSPV